MSDSSTAENPGPFMFAWADAGEAFSAAHWRFDEEIVSFRVTHEEGDFPALEVEIRNPRVGLLAPGRKVWAWFAFNKAWTPEVSSEPPDVVPLFFGRLVALPEDIDQESIQLQFIARPTDFAEQKEMLAAAMRVRPYWDGIWFAPENRYDPDNVLESRPELWHIDRVTHEVTASNILNGEDGSATFGEDKVPFDSVSVSYGQAPLRRVNVTASVSWDQRATDESGLDFSRFLAFGSGYSILTFTGDGLQKNWWKPGQSLKGGWRVASAEAMRVDGIGGAVWGYGLRSIGPPTGLSYTGFGKSYIASDDWHDVIVPEWAVAQSFQLSGPAGGVGISFPPHILGVPRWRIVPTLKIGYAVSRQKSEQLSFTIEADVQSVVTEPGDEEVMNLTFSSSEIASPVDPVDPTSDPSSLVTEVDGALFKLPIGKVSNRVYFSSTRGTQSVEYLLALARARLLARARCVNIDFEIPFVDAINFDLSCRKNLAIEDRRLPGGIAAGKITGYTLSGDGDSGVLACVVSIGCTVGKGNSVDAIAGTPTYVDEGYVDSGYQYYSGEFVMPVAGELIYETIEGLPANDDGVDFDRMNPDDFVLSVTKTGTVEAQRAAMGTKAPEPNDVFDRLNQVPTTLEVVLRPLEGGPFETLFNLNVSSLMVPKTIDLEAESTE